jgi:two-component system CheB/CheR fusion protein
MLNVVDDLQPWEVPVQDLQNRNYRLRITPYRTMDNRIEGVVLAFVDTSGLKRSSVSAARRGSTDKRPKRDNRR